MRSPEGKLRATEVLESIESVRAKKKHATHDKSASHRKLETLKALVSQKIKETHWEFAFSGTTEMRCLKKEILKKHIN